MSASGCMDSRACAFGAHPPVSTPDPSPNYSGELPRTGDVSSSTLIATRSAGNRSPFRTRARSPGLRGSLRFARSARHLVRYSLSATPASRRAVMRMVMPTDLILARLVFSQASTHS